MTAAVQIAKYIKDEKHLYGDMQLLKILYYTQVWSLVWTGRPLFTEEIEAWSYGPVVRRVYGALKSGDLDFVDSDLTDAQRQIVDAVYDFYGVAGGVKLSGLTHSELPWL